MIKTISSLTNPEIKELVKLQTPKESKQKGKFLAEGLRVCSTIIANGFQPLQFYVTEKMKDFALGLVQENLITLVSQNVMDKISSASSASGLIGVFKIPEQKPLNQITSGIVLTQISDPGNMGTLIRTAAALNIKTVVIIEGAHPWAPKVIQASAGNIANVNIFQLSWPELIKNKKDLKLSALVVSGGKEPKDIEFKNSLLVIGNEAHGIPNQWVEQCDYKLTLPMPGNTESLNAAIAGSIAMYLFFLP